MTLAALTWKQLPSQTVVANATIAQILDAMYTAYTSSTYADGTARTVGAGVAWNFSRYQLAGTTEAIYGVPVTNALNQKVIFAGSASVYTPVMLSTVTYAANTLYVGLAKNAGAFSSWTGASPFTSGQFSGYCNSFLKNATYGLNIKCYESQDAVIVMLYHVASGVVTCSSMGAGALVDPESSDTTNDAESDGKLYCVFGSGSNPNIAYGVGSHDATQCIFGHYSYSGASNNVNKFVAFQPGSGTMIALPRIGAYKIASPLQTRAGKFVKIPVIVGIDTSLTNASSFTTHTTFGGRVREAWMIGDAVGGQVLRNSGVDIGYTLSNSYTTAGDAFLLSR